MEQKKTRQYKIGILCCVAGAMSWGISGACSEAFFKDYGVNPAWVTAIRMLLSGVVLLVYTIGRNKIKLSDVTQNSKNLAELLLFALLGLALCQYAYLSAIRWTNSGTATVLQNLSIIVIAVYVCIVNQKLPQKRIVVCIILALIGVWLIATGGKMGNMEITPTGLLWGLGAALGAASYTLLSRNPVKNWGSIPATGMGMFLGGMVLFLVLQAWNLPEGLDLRGYGLLGVIVFIGTVGAFTLFLKGISMVGPVKASLLACLEPLTAATLSAVWLHSTFTITDLIGFACILVTVVLTA